jgi:hypothetical protein
MRIWNDFRTDSRERRRVLEAKGGTVILAEEGCRERLLESHLKPISDFFKKNASEDNGGNDSKPCGPIVD